MEQFKDFPLESRVWLYQTNRELSSTEANYVKEKLSAFTKDWAAHGKKLWAKADIVNKYFLAVVVDETITPPSGCSIDASVHFIKELGKELKVDFFTRMQILTEEGLIHFSDLSAKGGAIKIYDPLVDNLKDLSENWPCLAKNSSLAHVL